MSPIQQMLLGVGAVATKTYMDDVFSTYLYKGNGSSKTITNEIDLSGKGGMTWLKSRTNTSGANGTHTITDTVRGNTKQLLTSSNAAETTDSTTVTGFSSTGFGLGQADATNNTQDTYASWTFRKAPGFFDVVTYTGTGSKRTVSHNLGCQPGMIAVKRTDGTGDWEVWHKALGGTGSDFYWLRLNSTMAASTTSTRFGNWPADLPTSTDFTVGTAGDTNGSGSSYVAYVFAGGESTAATARSVEFDGNDHLSLAASDDFHLTGDFTIEGWFYPDSFHNYDRLFGLGNYDVNGGAEVGTYSTGLIYLYTRHVNSEAVRITATNPLLLKQWNHVAVVKSGSTVTMYVNGTSVGSYTQSEDFGAANNKNLLIGAAANNSGVADYFTGKISNFRIVKGTAVYTSSFRPPTEPLTSITNTTLLCCNNSSTTGKTTGGTITANGDPTASSDSPFDDPAGFVFGDAGDQNVIKCGSYVGNGAAAGPEINLGWEPQWVMIKRTDTAEIWNLYDSMRGITTQENDARLIPNSNAAEYSSADRVDLTPTGFTPRNNNTETNADGGTYIYLCVRRPDGYVGKPPSLGTDVFGLGMSNASSTTPCHVTNFITDFAFVKTPASTNSWYTGARLMGLHHLLTDTTAAEANNTDYTWDSNTGFAKVNGTNWQHWAWKRHAGFEVVTYTGDGVSGRQISHSMNKTVEMIWIKCRSITKDWPVYHKGLNGGSSPEDYLLLLNETGAESNDQNVWNDTSPSATNFTIGSSSKTNSSGETYIAMLFASVDGISKVGYYDGLNSSQTITTGFQPRFVIIRCTTDSNDWYVLDTLRGWGAGVDENLRLNDTVAQNSDDDFGAPTSTGFTLTGNMGQVNVSGEKFIYYAHA